MVVVMPTSFSRELELPLTDWPPLKLDIANWSSTLRKWPLGCPSWAGRAGTFTSSRVVLRPIPDLRYPRTLRQLESRVRPVRSLGQAGHAGARLRQLRRLRAIATGYEKAAANCLANLDIAYFAMRLI